MSISTVLRQAVSVEISLSNPLNEELRFLVSLQVRKAALVMQKSTHERDCFFIRLVTPKVVLTTRTRVTSSIVNNGSPPLPPCLLCPAPRPPPTKKKGEGVLGDQTFTLDPLASSTYTLYYSPLRVQSHSGSVTFSAEAVGQFWYRLELRADPCPPVRCVDRRSHTRARCDAERRHHPTYGEQRMTVPISSDLRHAKTARGHS